MSNVKYTAVIGKYTRDPASKARRRAVNQPRQREDARQWLGAAGMFVLYFAVVVWALMGVVAR